MPEANSTHTTTDAGRAALVPLNHAVDELELAGDGLRFLLQALATRDEYPGESVHWAVTALADQVTRARDHAKAASAALSGIDPTTICVEAQIGAAVALVLNAQDGGTQRATPPA
jgi:hypothetical protein